MEASVEARRAICCGRWTGGSRKGRLLRVAVETDIEVCQVQAKAACWEDEDDGGDSDDGPEGAAEHDMTYRMRYPMISWDRYPMISRDILAWVLSVACTPGLYQGLAGRRQGSALYTETQLRIARQWGGEPPHG